MYNIEELDLKNDTAEEQARTREIFENIRDRLKKGESISEHEKDFLGMGVILSTLNDGKLEDYPACENFKFKKIYLSYFHDISGQNNYEKIKRGVTYVPNENEIIKDINYLTKVSSDWEKVISITNHTNELLNHISRETREELKTIEKNKGHLLFKKDKMKYILDRRRLLLQSKYIYCKALLIFEIFENKDFIFTINGINVEINEYSIIHILWRHFSEITKRNPLKSYHGEDIYPEYLNQQLKDIFDVIEQSGLYANNSIGNVYFKYKGIDYAIWINERTKQIKGEGNVNFNRLETFYPIEEEKELNKLNNNFDYHQINDEIGIYIKKIENQANE